MPTHIEVARAGALASQGLASVETALEASSTITPSGSNQATAFSNLPSAHLFVTITADENVFVAIGTSPDASTTPRRALTAGTTRSFAFAAGQQVAVLSR